MLNESNKDSSWKEKSSKPYHRNSAMGLYIQYGKEE